MLEFRSWFTHPCLSIVTSGDLWNHTGRLVLGSMIDFNPLFEQLIAQHVAGILVRESSFTVDLLVDSNIDSRSINL